MSLMDKLEQAVGNEYLVSQNNLLSEINQKNERQADSNTIVSINRNSQPDSNKIVNLKQIDA
ncbi:Uncharacterised protein [Legionella spiritensis]|nr:hypothetical protein [Legionella spiritensis]VEG89602.1 Uncharacterised protein [Legionella spiritensis]VEG92584.1 Uncharacterised protein [Legionella spiritensis]